jgi:hypothetical protein
MLLDAARLFPFGVDTLHVQVRDLSGAVSAAAALPRAQNIAESAMRGVLTPAQYRALVLLIQVILLIGFLASAGVLLSMQGRSPIALLGAAGFVGMGLNTSVLAYAPSMVGAALSAGFVATFVLLLGVFCTAFPDGRVRYRWAWGVLALLLVYGLLFVAAMITSHSGLYPVANLFLFLGFALSFVAFGVRYWRDADEEEQMQIRWVVLGFAIAVVSLGTWVALINLFRDPGSPWFWSARLAAYVATLGYLGSPLGVVISLLRYRLWDAEAVWSRSAAVAALTLTVTALVAVVSTAAKEALGATGPTGLLVGGTVAAALFGPAQRRLSAWAERKFMRGLHAMRTELPPLVGYLRDAEGERGVARAVVQRVMPAVHATRAAVLVPSAAPSQGAWNVAAAEGVAEARAAAWCEQVYLEAPRLHHVPRRHPWKAHVAEGPRGDLFPVRVALRSECADGSQPVQGWLALGPRPDGSSYSSDDLDALAEVARAVGQALRVARVHEWRNAELLSALSQIRDDLNRLAPSHSGLPRSDSLSSIPSR